MLYTDALQSYRILDDQFRHAFVDHTVEYVRGRVSTRTFYRKLLAVPERRTIKGTYIAPRGWHRDAYLDEQVFRFNNRELPNAARLEMTFEGRRLTYKAVDA